MTIGSAYKGDVFDVTFSMPREKDRGRFIGIYGFPAPSGKLTIAVKIIDMLGDEIQLTKHV